MIANVKEIKLKKTENTKLETKPNSTFRNHDNATNVR